jgi:hypothetical protein
MIEKDLIDYDKGRNSRYDAACHQFLSNGD